MLLLLPLLFNAQNIVNISNTTTNKKKLADSLFKKSYESINNDNFNEAIINANQCLNLYSELDLAEGVSNSLYLLAESHAYLGNHKKSYDLALQSISICEKHDNISGIADCLEVTGNYFELYKNDLDAAYEQYSKGLKLCQMIDYKKRWAYLLGNIARIRFKQNLLPEALAYNLESLNIKEKIKDSKGQGYSLHKIGQVYLKQGNLKKAKEYALKSMELGKEYNYLENIKRSAELLNEIYKTEGNYKLASEMYELYIAARDSINNISLQKIALQKEMQHRFDKKQTADSLKVAEERLINKVKFEQEKKQRLLLIGGMTLTLLLSVLIFTRYKIIQKQKSIIEQKEVETQRQKKLVEEKQKEILDSIQYARRIQMAQIPNEQRVLKMLQKIKKS